jgi:hypothetical protein
MTSRFRSNRDTVFNSGYEDVLPDSETFNLADLTGLLAVENAAGMRVYYGMDENYGIHAILVAVDDDGNDILPQENSLLGSDPEIIMEQGIRCPPTCPAGESPLNT